MVDIGFHQLKLKSVVELLVVVKLGFQLIFHLALLAAYLAFAHTVHEVIVVTPYGALVVEESRHRLHDWRSCVKRRTFVGVGVKYIETGDNQYFVMIVGGCRELTHIVHEVACRGVAEESRLAYGVDDIVAGKGVDAVGGKLIFIHVA